MSGQPKDRQPMFGEEGTLFDLPDQPRRPLEPLTEEELAEFVRQVGASARHRTVDPDRPSRAYADQTSIEAGGIAEGPDEGDSKPVADMIQQRRTPGQRAQEELDRLLAPESGATSEELAKARARLDRIDRARRQVADS